MFSTKMSKKVPLVVHLYWLIVRFGIWSELEFVDILEKNCLYLFSVLLTLILYQYIQYISVAGGPLEKEHNENRSERAETAPPLVNYSSFLHWTFSHCWLAGDRFMAGLGKEKASKVADMTSVSSVYSVTPWPRDTVDSIDSVDSTQTVLFLQSRTWKKKNVEEKG